MHAAGTNCFVSLLVGFLLSLLRLQDDSDGSPAPSLFLSPAGSGHSYILFPLFQHGDRSQWPPNRNIQGPVMRGPFSQRLDSSFNLLTIVILHQPCLCQRRPDKDARPGDITQASYVIFSRIRTPVRLFIRHCFAIVTCLRIRRQIGF